MYIVHINCFFVSSASFSFLFVGRLADWAYSSSSSTCAHTQRECAHCAENCTYKFDEYLKWIRVAVSELDDDYISLVICDRARSFALVNTITTRENICAHTMWVCVIVVESKLVYVSPANDLSTLYSSSYLLSFALSCISFWWRFVCVCSTLAAILPPPLPLSLFIFFCGTFFFRSSFSAVCLLWTWCVCVDDILNIHWSCICPQSVRLSLNFAWPWHCWCACEQKIEKRVRRPRIVSLYRSTNGQVRESHRVHAMSAYWCFDFRFALFSCSRTSNETSVEQTWRAEQALERPHVRVCDTYMGEKKLRGAHNHRRKSHTSAAAIASQQNSGWFGSFLMFFVYASIYTVAQKRHTK